MIYKTYYDSSTMQSVTIRQRGDIVPCLLYDSLATGYLNNIDTVCYIQRYTILVSKTL